MNETETMACMDTGRGLAALIRDVRVAENWSQQDIANRAARAGHKLSKQKVSDLQTKPLISIKGELIRALAEGLGISPTRVGLAALESMGIPAAKPNQSLREVIVDSTEIDTRTRSTLLAVLSAAERSDAPATVTELPQRTYPGAEEVEAAHPGERRGPKKNQSEKPPSPLSGFNPDEE